MNQFDIDRAIAIGVPAELLEQLIEEAWDARMAEPREDYWGFDAADDEPPYEEAPLSQCGCGMVLNGNQICPRCMPLEVLEGLTHPGKALGMLPDGTDYTIN